MKPPPVPENQPRGFDRGLQFLVAVLAFTVVQRYLIPRELFRETFRYVVMGFASFIIIPIVILWQSRRSARPPRRWALILTMVWAALLLTVYGAAFLKGFLKGYSEAQSSAANRGSSKLQFPFRERAEKEEPEEQNDIAQCWGQLKSIEGAKEIWRLEHPPATPGAKGPRGQRKRPATPPIAGRQENPSESDLFGPTLYIAEKPKCPKGGTYIIGALDERPRCTFPTHSWSFGRVLVVDESGVGLAGVTVTSSPHGELDQTITTETNGLSSNGFSVNSYRDGAREIYASFPGYKPAVIPFPSNWPAKIVLHKEAN